MAVINTAAGNTRHHRLGVVGVVQQRVCVMSCNESRRCGGLRLNGTAVAGGRSGGRWHGLRSGFRRDFLCRRHGGIHTARQSITASLRSSRAEEFIVFLMQTLLSGLQWPGQSEHSAVALNYN